MNTTERLQRIRSRCVELLESAEKRTAGKWAAIHGDSYSAYPTVMRGNGPHFIILDATEPEGETFDKDFRWYGADADADFIAACAGAAEAGWRSTIAVIDWILEVAAQTPPGMAWAPQTYTLINTILAAWPEELL